MGQGSCKASDSIVTPGTARNCVSGFTAAATCSTRPSNPDACPVVGGLPGSQTVGCNPTGCGYTTSGCTVADQVDYCDPSTM